jgi:hypothetical protein
MTKLNITTICRKETESRKPEMKDWGFSFMTVTELAALRIAYSYRESPHGVKVEHYPAVEQFIVTIWNDRAKEMGCDV